MKHNFEIGDRVKVLTNKSVYYGFSGKVVGIDDNFISVEFEIHIGNGETERRYSHFKNPDSLEVFTEKFKKLKDKIKKEQAKIAKRVEWRPKKGELIEVSHDGEEWEERTFMVYMDGLYYVPFSMSRNLLHSYKFARRFHARPIQKVEPKFKVGDVVKVKINSGKNDAFGVIRKYYENMECTIPEKKEFKNGYGESYLIKFDLEPSGVNSYLYSEDKIEKVQTIPIEDGKISFRGLSKGIMVDKNIVMYYSHRYDRILISEAEKPLPKKYVWVEVKREDLKKGDIFTSGYSKDHDRMFIFNKLIAGDTISGFEYSEANGYNSTVGFGNDEIYKAIEV